MSNQLTKFGQFLVSNFRDKAIHQHDLLLKGQLKAPKLRNLQEAVAMLSEEQRQTMRNVVIDMLDTAMHDLLFALQDAHDRAIGIEVLVDGKNIAEESGMLNAEHVGETGWIQKFSRFGSAQHIN